MSSPESPRITYIGGPTALIEWQGVRLLTDPTFDPAGGDYTNGPVTLRKLLGPAIAFDALTPIDAVLLSHDQHFDNFDRAGRNITPKAKTVLTTTDGAGRLGGNAIGLIPWQTTELRTALGAALRITGTPARHGIEGSESRSGPVTGFVLEPAHNTGDTIYLSGDTVWYEGVAEVARRFQISIAIPNMGAARVPSAGPDPVTMTADDGIQLANAMPSATIIPLHFEAWAHLTESKDFIAQKFLAAGLSQRLRWLEPGVPTAV